MRLVNHRYDIDTVQHINVCLNISLYGTIAQR